MKRFLLAGGVAATTFILSAQTALAQTAASGAPKDTSKQPLNLPTDQVQQQASNGGSNSGGLGRTLIGLLVVCAIIYGLYWVLKQVKKAREEQASGSGLHSLASLPLGPNRSLHMIRAGREIVLVGVAESGVSPIRSYTEEEAFEAGLISDDPDDATRTGGSGSGSGGGAAAAGFASPANAIGTALRGLRERTVRK
jgi:flagellar protein FliO/FliZ